MQLLSRVLRSARKQMGQKQGVNDAIASGACVDTVFVIPDATNNDTTKIFDAMLTFSNVATFFTQPRKSYAYRMPSDRNFNAVMADVQRAFNLLAAHWDGRTVSFRYDFLILLRLGQTISLPQPYNPRPTGSNWYYLVTSTTP